MAVSGPEPERWSNVDAASTVARGPFRRLLTKKRRDRSSSRQNGSVMASSASSDGGLDHLGARPGEGALAQRADPDSHHIAIDGMGEPHLDPASVYTAGDQSLGFDSVDRIWIGQLSQSRLAERLAQGEQLEH